MQAVISDYERSIYPASSAITDADKFVLMRNSASRLMQSPHSHR
jgi:hypothetical protein